MSPHWSPERFTAALAAIRDAMSLNAAGLGRLAGISRSQAGRWARGEHQPAYPNVRQLGIAVYREFPGLAQELMLAAGYPRITDEDIADAPGPLDDLLPWTHDWERQVAEEEELPLDLRRRMITDWRAARSEARARRRQRQSGAPATGAA